MGKVFDKIQINPLFNGIGLDDFEGVLHCVEGRVQEYEKGSVIQLAGNPVNTVGLVISGIVQVIWEDGDGKQNLMAELHEGARRFTISFSREALAAYLCAARSAMSAELSKMQLEGLIHYERNSFKILE